MRRRMVCQVGLHRQGQPEKRLNCLLAVGHHG